MTKQERRELRELAAYKREASKIARDFNVKPAIINKIMSAKNQTQVANIMGDIRRAV